MKLLPPLLSYEVLDTGVRPPFVAVYRDCIFQCSNPGYRLSRSAVSLSTLLHVNYRIQEVGDWVRRIKEPPNFATSIRYEGEEFKGAAGPQKYTATRDFVEGTIEIHGDTNYGRNHGVIKLKEQNLLDLLEYLERRNAERTVQSSAYWK